MDPEELKTAIAEAVRASLAESNDMLSKEELRELMKESVADALSHLGIDSMSPVEVQKDLQFLRELRLTSERVKNRTIVTLVGLLVAGLAAATWLGIKSLIAP